MQQRTRAVKTNRLRHDKHRATPLAVAIALCFCGAAHAATIAVNDASEGSVGGKCTLADAVTALNTAAPKNSCAGGDGNNDTIDLSFFIAPTTIAFSLPSIGDANSALSLSKPVSIRAGLDGSGNPLVTLTRSTVSGAPSFRLIATSKNLSIDGLKMSNGVSPDLGGAINASGSASLTIANSSFDANSASTSGGALAADCGKIRLTKSTLSGNLAGKNGGGVYTSNYLVGGGHCVSTIALYTSKVTGNTTTIGNGAGVYSFYGNVYARYSSFDGNVAGGQSGGGIYAYVDADLYSCTVSNNRSAFSGGGMRVANQVSLTNTTVTGNFSTNDTGALSAYRVSIFFSTITANTVGPQNYPLGGVGFIASGDVTGSIITGNMGDNIIGEAPVNGSNNIIVPSPFGHSQTLPGDTLSCNPNLAPLADNGGPTRTMALGDGSCALNTGPVYSPSLPSDQRGPKFARRVGSATDIGAFELQTNDRIFYDGFGGP